MAKPYVIFGILILQLYVNAAPSDISKTEDIATLQEPEVKLDEESATNDENDTSQQSVRQKRFYNYYGYGFPPISPVVYPSYVKRDESFDTGVYGANDPFQQIHQRLQEIASVIRQPRPPPPPPSPVPIFFPVIYVPQNCACNTTTDNNTSIPQTSTVTEANQTNPDVTQRIDNDEDYETEFEDNNRPISFDPIVLNTTLLRPPPPVEHGSNQAGVSNSNSSVTENTPIGQAQGGTAPNNFNVDAAQTVPQAPSICDGAVLSCCHQLQVTYDCFALQGCPDPTSYGNPCEVNVILSVIYKFQNYYAQRNG